MNIRSIFKKIEARRLGTPIMVSSDGSSSEWKVRMKKYVNDDGEVQRVLDMKDVCKILIAEQIGTDDPKQVHAAFKSFQEEARIRMICRDELAKAQRRAEQADKRKLLEVAQQRECESRSHQPARIAPSPSHFRDMADDDADGRPAVVAEATAVITASEPATTTVTESAEPAPIALEEALSVIENPVERDMVRAYMAEHPAMAHFATHGRGTVHVAIRDGQVFAGYREVIWAHKS